MLLCDEELSQTQNHVTAASVLARTEHHQLCQSAGLDTFMQTNSEALMKHGIETGAETFKYFLAESGWTRKDIDKTVCHQVGVAHRKLLFEALGLETQLDYATLETLGNTGAAAVPLTLALALEAGHIGANDRVALLGIGSGINCQMIGVEWQATRVMGILQDCETASVGVN